MKFTLTELRVFLECIPLAKIGIETKLEDIAKGGEDIKILEIFIGDSAFEILVYFNDDYLIVKLRTDKDADSFYCRFILHPNLPTILSFMDSVSEELKRLLATKHFEESRRPK